MNFDSWIKRTAYKPAAPASESGKRPRSYIGLVIFQRPKGEGRELDVNFTENTVCCHLPIVAAP
jgi:hypothetical protein